MPVVTPEVLEVGRHRMLCADSTDPEMAERLYGDANIPCVLTEWAMPLPESLAHRFAHCVQVLGSGNGCWLYRADRWERIPLGPFGPRFGQHTDDAIQVVASALKQFAPAGCLVADPFLGTGTTLLACELTGRTCYGMELNPFSCFETMERYEGMAQ